jgi:membrane-associated phospholipid phosphatase
LISFFLLEHRSVKPHIIHCALDDMIPFCEYFIIPYVLWYGFVAVTLWYFAFRCEKREEYWCLASTLMIGMTAFLVVSYVYPNGQELRPVLREGNCFIRAVRVLYQIDTPTNVLPSMHVFNAVSCCVAICRNQRCRSRGGLIAGTKVLTALIILSTMFLKQHSVVDVCMALVLYGLCYRLVYVTTSQYRKKTAEHGPRLGHGQGRFAS